MTHDAFLYSHLDDADDWPRIEYATLPEERGERKLVRLSLIVTVLSLAALGVVWWWA